MSCQHGGHTHHLEKRQKNSIHGWVSMYLMGDPLGQAGGDAVKPDDAADEYSDEGKKILPKRAGGRTGGRTDEAGGRARGDRGDLEETTKKSKPKSKQAAPAARRVTRVRVTKKGGNAGTGVEDGAVRKAKSENDF